MRDKIIAIIILISVIGFVTVNSIVIDRAVDDLLKEVESLDFQDSEAKTEAERVWKKFKDNSAFISLSVSHDDLSNIEDTFREMIGAIATDDKDSADIAKYRLLSYLEHLRRLSGASIDAII